MSDGTNGTEIFGNLAAAEDGGVVLAGPTYGNWSGENAGEYDFAAVKLR